MDDDEIDFEPLKRHIKNLDMSDIIIIILMILLFLMFLYHQSQIEACNTYFNEILRNMSYFRNF